MADIVNGFFELGGAVVLLLHVRRLYLDKHWRGLSPWPFAWFLTWGWFNVLFFYPSVGCWWSFWGGVAVVIVNSIYVCMLWWYRNN